MPALTFQRALAATFAFLSLLSPVDGHAHDIGFEIRDLQREAQRLESTMRVFERRPSLPTPPQTPAAQRRALGEAEVEHALGHTDRALSILLGRLADPSFRQLPEYVNGLLLTAEVLEQEGELAGAMMFARQAMEAGRTPQDMAEAGARWFKLARLTNRLDDRVRMYELWLSRGGADASETEAAAQVMYEVGFALRAQGETGKARQLLSRVPSESAFGSRAAFLAGTTYVQDGDLVNAERWFAALKDWPLLDLPEDHPQTAVERELRALAALSTARLRYESGDLGSARSAYAEVPEDSLHRREACWELAFLESEAKRQRAAIKHLECVKTLGVRGVRSVDLELLESSMLAHLSRYGASIEAYKALHARVVAERDLVAKSFAQVKAPADFLFDGMERTALEAGRDATPGPATLLGDAWTPDLDRAYRVDEGIGSSRGTLVELLTEVNSLRAKLLEEDRPDPLELRRLNLKRLLQEIDHLAGHVGETEFRVTGRHASAGSVGHDHGDDRAALARVSQRLARLRKRVSQRMTALEREGTQLRADALAALDGLETELSGLSGNSQMLARSAQRPMDAAARAALNAVVDKLDDAAMRAEVGVLDTFWLKKEARTEEIDRIIAAQKETERQVEEALAED